MKKKEEKRNGGKGEEGKKEEEGEKEEGGGQGDPFDRPLPSVTLPLKGPLWCECAFIDQKELFDVDYLPLWSPIANMMLLSLLQKRCKRRCWID